MAKRGTPLPFHLRQKIIGLREIKKSYRAIGRELDVSDKTVKKYLRLVSAKSLPNSEHLS